MKLAKENNEIKMKVGHFYTGFTWLFEIGIVSGWFNLWTSVNNWENTHSCLEISWFEYFWGPFQQLLKKATFGAAKLFYTFVPKLIKLTRCGLSQSLVNCKARNKVKKQVTNNLPEGIRKLLHFPIGPPGKKRFCCVTLT